MDNNKQNKRNHKLDTYDYLWFFALIQLIIHLASHWDLYYCGFDFNIFMIFIYSTHFLRLLLNYFALLLRSKFLTWIGYSLIIPVLVWSCMMSFYMNQYSAEVLDYENCSTFFIGVVFSGYGFLTSIYSIITVVMKPDQSLLSEQEEGLLRLTAIN